MKQRRPWRSRTRDVRHILEATRLISRNPRLWRYILRPLGAALLAFSGVILAGYFVLVPLLRGLLESNGIASGASTWISVAAYGLLWFFVGGFVFIAIASLLSSLLWDGLSIEIEELVAGEAVNLAPPQGVLMGDGIKRMLLTVMMGVLALCAGGLFVIGPVAIAGIVGLLDYTSNVYARRNVLLRGQASRVFRLPGAFSFGVIAGLVTLIPLLNVALLPVMVAAGTIMVVRSEGGRIPLTHTTSGTE